MDNPKGFHARDGWYFRRTDGGGVLITAVTSETRSDVVLLDAATWASAVASVSARGENAETFAEASRLHGDAAVTDAPD
jgi:hypothetical protein